MAIDARRIFNFIGSGNIISYQPFADMANAFSYDSNDLMIFGAGGAAELVTDANQFGNITTYLFDINRIPFYFEALFGLRKTFTLDDEREFPVDPAYQILGPRDLRIRASITGNGVLMRLWVEDGGLTGSYPFETELQPLMEFSLSNASFGSFYRIDNDVLSDYGHPSKTISLYKVRIEIDPDTGLCEYEVGDFNGSFTIDSGALDWINGDGKYTDCTAEIQLQQAGFRYRRVYDPESEEIIDSANHVRLYYIKTDLYDPDADELTDYLERSHEVA